MPSNRFLGLILLTTLISCGRSSETKEPPRQLQEPRSLDLKSTVTEVCFSADDKSIFAGLNDMTVVSINRTNMATEWKSAPYPASVLSVAASGDGQYLAATCGDNMDRSAQVVVSAAISKEQKWAKKNVLHDMQSVAFSSNSKLLAVANYFSILIYDVETGKQLHFFSGHPVDVDAPQGHVGAVSSMQFMKQDEKLVTTGWDRNLKIWDLKTEREEKNFPEAEPINALLVSADESRLLTASTGALHVWNLATSKTDTILSYDGELRTMCFLKSGRYVVAGDHLGNITVWTMGTFAKVRELKQAHPRGVWTVSSSRDGEYCVSAGEDGKVTLWQADWLIQPEHTPPSK